MSKIPYLLERDLSKYVGLEEVTSLGTVSDVTTLLDVFEETVRDVSYKKIKCIVKDEENYFYVVVSEGEFDFDIFDFINRNFNSDSNISCTNVRYLYPKRLSRGIFEGELDDDEDVATSFLDEDELDLPFKREYELYFVRMGVNLKITGNGLMIGRSAKKVDYLIRGNGNIGRIHCNLYINKSGDLMVHDFESLNGTFVNNKKVHSSSDVKLSEGDILLLADEEFRVL